MLYNCIIYYAVKNNGGYKNETRPRDPWFDQEALQLLESYQDNNNFNMLDPNIRNVVNNTLFGQTVKHLHDESRFNDYPMPPNEWIKVFAQRELLKQLLTDPSIPVTIRQKTLSLFQPTHLDADINFELTL